MVSYIPYTLAYILVSVQADHEVYHLSQTGIELKEAKSKQNSKMWTEMGHIFQGEAKHEQTCWLTPLC